MVGRRYLRIVLQRSRRMAPSGWLLSLSWVRFALQSDVRLSLRPLIEVEVIKGSLVGPSHRLLFNCISLLLQVARIHANSDRFEAVGDPLTFW